MKQLSLTLLLIALPVNHCLPTAESIDATTQAVADITTPQDIRETTLAEEPTRRVRTEHPVLTHLRKHRAAYMALGAAGLTVAAAVARQLMQSPQAQTPPQSETALIVHPQAAQLCARITNAAISDALRGSRVSASADQRLLRELFKRAYGESPQPQRQAPATTPVVHNQATSRVTRLALCNGSVDATPAPTSAEIASAATARRREALARALEPRALLAAAANQQAQVVPAARVLPQPVVHARRSSEATPQLAAFQRLLSGLQPITEEPAKVETRSIPQPGPQNHVPSHALIRAAQLNQPAQLHCMRLLNQPRNHACRVALLALRQPPLAQAGIGYGVLPAQAPTAQTETAMLPYQPIHDGYSTHESRRALPWARHYLAQLVAAQQQTHATTDDASAVVVHHAQGAAAKPTRGIIASLLRPYKALFKQPRAAVTTHTAAGNLICDPKLASALRSQRKAFLAPVERPLTYVPSSGDLEPLNLAYEMAPATSLVAAPHTMTLADIEAFKKVLGSARTAQLGAQAQEPQTPERRPRQAMVTTDGDTDSTPQAVITSPEQPLAANINPRAIAEAAEA